MLPFGGVFGNQSYRWKNQSGNFRFAKRFSQINSYSLDIQIPPEVRCLGYVFGVQIPNLRRWPWMSSDWESKRYPPQMPPAPRNMMINNPLIRPAISWGGVDDEEPPNTPDRTIKAPAIVWTPEKGPIGPLLVGQLEVVPRWNKPHQIQGHMVAPFGPGEKQLKQSSTSWTTGTMTMRKWPCYRSGRWTSNMIPCPNAPLPS